MTFKYKKTSTTIEIDQIIYSCYHEICYRNVPNILLTSVEYNRMVMQIKQFVALAAVCMMSGILLVTSTEISAQQDNPNMTSSTQQMSSSDNQTGANEGIPEGDDKDSQGTSMKGSEGDDNDQKSNP